MLSFIRNNVQSVFVKSILGLIVLVFVFFGVGGYETEQANVIANIEGELITLSDFQQRYAQEYNRFKQSYPGKIEKWQENYLKKQVLDGLINQALIVRIANEKGFNVTDLELADWIYQNESFHTDERFDLRKYEQMLRQNRVGKIEFEKKIRGSLTYQKYITFIQTNLPLGKGFIEDQFYRNNEEFHVSILDIDDKNLEKKVVVTNAEIQSYYDSNKKKFIQEKTLQLDYFKLTSKDFEQDIIVRDKELSSYYQKNKKSEFTTPKQYNSRHILIGVKDTDTDKEKEKAKKKADKIYSQIKKNKKKFASLAKKYSTDLTSKKKGGELGWVKKGTFVKEFEKSLEDLKVNEISKPLKTSFGYHIIQLLGEKKERVQTLAKVKKVITRKIKEKKVARIIDAKIEKIKEELNKNKIKSYADSLKKEIKKSDPFHAQSYVRDIYYSSELYQEIKDKKIGDENVYKADDNEVLIFKISKIKPESTKPLSEVKSEISSLLKEDKKQKMIFVELNKLKQKIKTKNDFKKLAKKLKKELDEEKIKRTDQAFLKYGKMPKTSKIVFSMNKENKIISNVENGKNLLIYFNKVAISTEIDKEEELKEIKKQHQSTRANLIFSGLLQELRKEIKIDFNKNLIQTLDIPVA